jgi:hypothetical protein
MRLGLSLGLTTSSGAFAFADADAEAYVAAMTVEPDATRKGLIDTLVGGLKADGIWTKLDWLCLLAAHDEQAALLNAVSLGQSLTKQGTLTFTTDRGHAGNGTTGYLDTGELPAAAGNQYAQNSACVGTWCNQQNGGAAAQNHVGNISTSRTAILARNTAGNETFIINDGTLETLQANTGSRVGHRAVSRTGAGIKRGFHNGVRTANLTTASVSVPAGNLSFLKSGAAFSVDRLAAVYVGAGLSDTEVGNMHSRLNTYLTAIGAN